MSNLQLSLKGQWFDITKSGIKKEDYRSINKYWAKRLVFNIDKVLQYYNCKNEDDSIYLLLTHGSVQGRFAFKNFDFNIMTLGYPKSTDSSRILKIEHKGIEIGYGKQECGAEPNKLYFIIKHGEIIK